MAYNCGECVWGGGVRQVQEAIRSTLNIFKGYRKAVESLHTKRILCAELILYVKENDNIKVNV